MPDDDALIGQGIVDERNEARRPGLVFGSDGSTTYADEHEGGQLRIAVAGEQVPLLPLPDAAIPTTDEPQAVDEVEPARVLGSDAAVAVGRFDVDGPHGYRAKSGGPVRTTRDEAERDELETLERPAKTVEAPFVGHLAAPAGVELEEGAAVEVKLAVYEARRPVLERWSDTEWVPGVITGYRASTEDLEQFRRVNVRLADGRRLEGCHPECVRPLDFAELHRQRVEGHTSRRERLERKAEKRREWAESRARKADAAHARVHEIADGIPFGQPILVGHHSEGRHRRDVARIENGMRASIDHARQADKHEQAADGLESQLRGAIYSDDVDAVERLEEKLARLEQQRETMKARNAAYRKEHRAELKTLGAYERSQAVPHASYELQNLGGNITRTRERLEQLKRAAVIVAQGGRGRGRPMLARFASDCAECGERIEKEAEIVYYKLTREAVHAACDAKGA